jgi:hypothetical protein
MIVSRKSAYFEMKKFLSLFHLIFQKEFPAFRLLLLLGLLGSATNRVVLILRSSYTDDLLSHSISIALMVIGGFAVVQSLRQTTWFKEMMTLLFPGTHSELRTKGKLQQNTHSPNQESVSAKARAEHSSSHFSAEKAHSELAEAVLKVICSEEALQPLEGAPFAPILREQISRIENSKCSTESSHGGEFLNARYELPESAPRLGQLSFGLSGSFIQIPVEEFYRNPKPFIFQNVKRQGWLIAYLTIHRGLIHRLEIKMNGGGNLPVLDTREKVLIGTIDKCLATRLTKRHPSLLTEQGVQGLLKSEQRLETTSDRTALYLAFRDPRYQVDIGVGNILEEDPDYLIIWNKRSFSTLGYELDVNQFWPFLNAGSTAVRNKRSVYRLHQPHLAREAIFLINYNPRGEWHADHLEPDSSVHSRSCRLGNISAFRREIQTHFPAPFQHYYNLKNIFREVLGGIPLHSGVRIGIIPWSWRTPRAFAVVMREALSDYTHRRREWWRKSSLMDDEITFIIRSLDEPTELHRLFGDESADIRDASGHVIMPKPVWSKESSRSKSRKREFVSVDKEDGISSGWVTPTMSGQRETKDES